MKKITTNVLLMISVFSLTACTKENNSRHSIGQPGSGSIFYDWSEGAGLAVTYKLDLKTAGRSKAIGYNADLHAWDISRDGTRMIQSVADPSDYDGEIYRMIDMSSGKTLTEFKKAGTELSSFTEPLISPDMSLIAVPPTYDRGLLILNAQGDLLHEVVTIGGNKIGGHISWMPDNSIICTVGNVVYHLNARYDYGDVVTTLDFSDWNHVTVSNDGKKIAFAGGKHIWLMNADGSGQKQITTSSHEEGYPVFSPDGNLLLIGTRYSGETNAISRWELTMIPADGQQYNVDEGADAHVIPVKLTSSESTQELCDNIMEWR